MTSGYIFSGVRLLSFLDLFSSSTTRRHGMWYLHVPGVHKSPKEGSKTDKQTITLDTMHHCLTVNSTNSGSNLSKEVMWGLRLIKSHSVKKKKNLKRNYLEAHWNSICTPTRLSPNRFILTSIQIWPYLWDSLNMGRIWAISMYSTFTNHLPSK